MTVSTIHKQVLDLKAHQHLSCKYRIEKVNEEEKKLEKGSKRKERRKRERVREGGEDERPHENRLLCKSILSQVS